MKLIISKENLTGLVVDRDDVSMLKELLDTLSMVTLIDEQSNKVTELPRWIAVKDRLPYEDGQYLTCTTYGHFDLLSFAKTPASLLGHLGWKYEGTDHPCFYKFQNGLQVFDVTHEIAYWMPIPEMPEEGK